MRKLALLGVLLAASAQAQFNAHQFLTVGDSAYVVGFPEVVASGAEFSQLRFTPGGRYLAFTQRDLGMSGRRASPAMMDAKIKGSRLVAQEAGFIWDDQKRKLIRLPVGKDQGDLVIFSERLICFMGVTAGATEFLQMNPSSDSFTPMKSTTGWTGLCTDFRGKCVVLFNASRNAYSLLTETGFQDLPTPEKGWHYSMFEQGGKALILFGTKQRDDPDGLLARRYEIATGKVQTLDHYDPPNMSELDPAPFGLHPLGQPIGRLFATDQKPRDPSAGNLGTYLGESVVSTDGKKVAYTLNGCVFIADILSVSSKDLIAMRNEEGKASAISNAKQLNTSLQIYMANNDDRMPGPEGLREKLRPYMKNDALFNTLVYTYNGPEKATDVADP